MICDRWQVAVMPFPFMERVASKRRPALALSNRYFNFGNGHTIMAMITTAKSANWPSDYAIEDLATAGLRLACYVRWKVFTLPNELIERTIGELGDVDRETLTIQARTVLVRS